MKTTPLSIASPFIIILTIFLFNAQAHAEKDTVNSTRVGQEVKKTPAETENKNTAQNKEYNENRHTIKPSKKVTEYRRESGQVYRIELDNIIGEKQVIDETDSDGRIEAKENNFEDTPNLPKWKIISW